MKSVSRISVQCLILQEKIFNSKKVLAKKKSARYIINVVNETTAVTRKYGSVAQSG